MDDSTFDSLFLAFQQAVVGRYSLERELGRGGMGVVYLAREVRLDRPVAIKLLPPDLAARPELRERFMREARTAARLSHPFIVPIHAVDELGGFVFIVMAYVDGGTLAQRIAGHGPMPAQEVTRMMREVAWALAYAHAQGIVHRDVKPANILIERGTGRALVADFGIARLSESSGDTAVGVVLGTPEYMSPEQAAAEDLDGRSDLYALGVVAYLALTGTLPFNAPTAQGMLAMHLTQTPPPVAAAARGIPRALAQSIDRCLAKQPSDRFETGEALADALEPGLERSRDVAIPLRSFLDRRRMVMLFVPALATVGMAASIIVELAKRGMWWSPIAVAVGFVAIGIVAPFAVFVLRMRKLMRLGYGLDDITSALRLLFERSREVFLYEFGTEPTTREKFVRGLSIAGLGIGAVALATWAVMGHVATPIAAPVSFVSIYVGGIATAFSRKLARLRGSKGSLWLRFWSSPMAERLAKISAFRLGARAIPADRPTELAIAMNAEAMFDGLPKDVRASLGDVPEVLRGLEAHARVARARIAELDAALADAQRGPSHAGSQVRQESLIADLTAARQRAEERLAELVSALENLRLDLLRLRAGEGSLDGITLDVASAREFGEHADRLLAGGRDVNRALRESKTPV